MPGIPAHIFSTCSQCMFVLVAYFQCRQDCHGGLGWAQVGEFYETIGIDAVMMVQYARLNYMGPIGNPPKAGCPIVNLRRNLRDLTDAGLSVVCPACACCAPAQCHRQLQAQVG